jgi:integrase
MSIDHGQFGAILAAAQAIDHRLLLKTLWQTGGRVTEVLRLRPCDVNRADGALRLLNEKQRRRERRQKLVFVSRDLAAELYAFARGLHIRSTVPFFRSNTSGPRPMSRSQAWRIVTDCSRRAGVLVPGQLGELVPASPLNFRHGNAVHQLREGVPLTEVQRQLGHSRLESTLVYLRLTDPERREIADRVSW